MQGKRTGWDTELVCLEGGVRDVYRYTVVVVVDEAELNLGQLVRIAASLRVPVSSPV